MRRNLPETKDLRIPAIANLNVSLPDLPTQRRIADILSALDDKIELNRQTNATVEAMAQAIFKEWFVDFNYPGATGDLVDSELGLIPAGWRITQIGEIFNFVIGGDWGKEESVNDYSNFCAVIRGTDIGDILSAQIEKVPRRYIQTSKLGKRELIEGDIVFEISGGSKNQATGRNLFVTKEILGLFEERVIAASFCRLIRSKDLSTAVFLGTHLRIFYDDGGTWDFQLQSTGISNFQFSDFESRHAVIVPPDTILEQFKCKVMPIYRTMGENIAQSITLAQIRDALLPRLMRGEIDV